MVARHELAGETGHELESRWGRLAVFTFFIGCRVRAPRAPRSIQSPANAGLRGVVDGWVCVAGPPPGTKLLCNLPEVLSANSGWAFEPRQTPQGLRVLRQSSRSVLPMRNSRVGANNLSMLSTAQVLKELQLETQNGTLEVENRRSNMQRDDGERRSA